MGVSPPAVSKVFTCAFDHLGTQGGAQCGVTARLSKLTHELDEPARSLVRGDDFRGERHSHLLSLRLAQELALGRGGGADIAEGSRGLECCQQVLGSSGDCRAERHRIQRLLPVAEIFLEQMDRWRQAS